MQKLIERFRGVPLDVSDLTFSEAMEQLWMLAANGWEIEGFEVWQDKVCVYVRQLWEKLR